MILSDNLVYMEWFLGLRQLAIQAKEAHRKRIFLRKASREEIVKSYMSGEISVDEYVRAIDQKTKQYVQRWARAIRKW